MTTHHDSAQLPVELTEASPSSKKVPKSVNTGARKRSKNEEQQRVANPITKRLPRDPAKAVYNAFRQVMGDDECKQFQVKLLNSDNPFVWSVKIPSTCFLDDAIQIFKDLEALPSILNLPPEVSLIIEFPTNYPSGPPFVRVEYPRFHQYTGHITVGGSICTENLTNTGWNPSMTIGALILSIKMQMIFSDPPAKVCLYATFPHFDPKAPYSYEEAKDAFQRSARYHNWRVD